MHPDLFAALPQFVVERVRALTPHDPFAHQPAAGTPARVLYAMHHALRAHENPALDVAIAAANALRAELLVLHPLPDSTPYASDRLHTFILQGARDVAQDLAARNIAYRLALPRFARSGERIDDDLLATLSEQASLVITDDFPVDPWRRWTAALVLRLDRRGVALWAVDTACVVPMQLCGRGFDRTFAYRSATRSLRAARVKAEWPTPTDVATPSQWVVPPGPERELVAAETPARANAVIADLIAHCNIDHTIGPVPHTRGGSTAGYARWLGFCGHGLARYAAKRNNALFDGVSRMSAYLHYGMVSPMRIAREAYHARSESAEKYLDELLVWREVAYTWCFYNEHHDTLAAIPNWATTTLKSHERDARPALLGWETLARARTGDAVWDAAQMSLLRHGELHNNVRMTWGKALLNWTPDAERCLDHLIDLNHRFALDGRDPASYGGLLWCLGLFDRPFTPEARIFGTVRPRSTREHAQRLDPARYGAMTSRPVVTCADGTHPRIAIVGAGIAGLMCARTLADHGLAVTLFDKGRGPGGRTSTRRADPYQWDHGAPSISAYSPLAQRWLDRWQQEGVLTAWSPRCAHAAAGKVSILPQSQSPATLVGTPAGNALAIHLAQGIAIRAGCSVACSIEVTRCERRDNVWALLAKDAASETERELGTFTHLLLATPPENIRRITNISPHAAPLVRAVAGVMMTPSWVAMLAWDRPLDLPFDKIDLDAGPLASAWRDNSKPERRGGADELWVLRASDEWSLRSIESSALEVSAELTREFVQVCAEAGVVVRAPAVLIAHRWRYAYASTPLNTDCLWLREPALGACGDWCAGNPVRGVSPRESGVERAILSGAALAGRVLNELAAATVAEAGSTGLSATGRGQEDESSDPGLFE